MTDSTNPIKLVLPINGEDIVVSVDAAHALMEHLNDLFADEDVKDSSKPLELPLIPGPEVPGIPRIPNVPYVPPHQPWDQRPWYFTPYRLGPTTDIPMLMNEVFS